MYKLRYPGITLPPVYVCDKLETDKAIKHGVPFIVRPGGWDDEKIIKTILFSYLVRKFPYINWTRVNGEHEVLGVHVPAKYRENPGEWIDPIELMINDGCEISIDDNGNKAYRETAGGIDEDIDLAQYTVQDDETYFTGATYVDIEALQALKLLPVFMDDIATAIKSNLQNNVWQDGWNKKLGAPLGYYQGTDEAPNLIIIDTSGSIPSGTAYTMIALADTLRSQVRADLIITSQTSKYWRLDEELPSQHELMGMIGGRNEAMQFYKILTEKILGKHWGNIIVFGDDDAPCEDRFRYEQEGAPTPAQLGSTKIDNLMSFHTHESKTPGYALWVKQACPNIHETIDTSWRRSIR